MNIEKLPENSELRKLLAGCEMSHEIERTYAVDGAVIVTCFFCPWKRVLDPIEEKIIRPDPTPEEIAAEEAREKELEQRLALL